MQWWYGAHFNQTGTMIRITSNFSQSLQTIREWSEIIEVLRKKERKKMLPTWNSVLCEIIKNGETPKLPKDIIRKLQTNISHQHRCKTP